MNDINIPKPPEGPKKNGEQPIDFKQALGERREALEATLKRAEGLDKTGVDEVTGEKLDSVVERLQLAVAMIKNLEERPKLSAEDQKLAELLLADSGVVENVAKLFEALETKEDFAWGFDKNAAVQLNQFLETQYGTHVDMDGVVQKEEGVISYDYAKVQKDGTLETVGEFNVLFQPGGGLMVELTEGGRRFSMGPYKKEEFTNNEDFIQDLIDGIGNVNRYESIRLVEQTNFEVSGDIYRFKEDEKNEYTIQKKVGDQALAVGKMKITLTEDEVQVELNNVNGELVKVANYPNEGVIHPDDMSANVQVLLRDFINSGSGQINVANGKSKPLGPEGDNI